MASTSWALSGEEQESIIKQRMQVDERLIRRLIKKLSALLTSKDAATLEAAKVSYQLELDQLQIHLSRLSAIATNTSAVEVASYEQELQDIEKQQQEAKETIIQLKQQLRDVQRDRANKLEYDAIAVEINKYPTRKELKQSLAKLETTLDGLKQESEKYDHVSKNAAERVKQFRQALESLHADIGFEVGERERREVERGEGEAEGEVEESRQASEVPNTPAAEAESEGIPRSASGLNPAAAAFKPITSDSRAASRGSSPSGTRRARKRQGTATTPKDGGSDEEGAWQEDEPPSSSRSSKRQKLNGRESLPVDGDSEEEEGSILPPVRR